MASNSSSNQVTNLDLSSLSNDADTTQLDSTRTNSALSIVACKHEIDQTMIKHLQILQGFKIVIVCDDSGSKMNNFSDIKDTRRNDLCSIVKIVLDIGIIFDTNGVDIHFLNGEILSKVKYLETIDWIFASPVNENKPLLFVLDGVFNSLLSQAEEETKLLLVVVSNGEVTDKNGNNSLHSFEQSMFARQSAEITYVSVFLYTDGLSHTGYFNEPGQTMKHVNVVGDFQREKNDINRSGRSDYCSSFGNYVVRALLSAVDPENQCLR
ncbi:unnamed protein product [Adineta steineri]|uniref:VWFA domain-containing protein n=1 Tax=Adineta steineri TaxID=433720 RepID=A0A819KUJ7_9BILA|nr:unnamed protein product [Adineta steineri]CAF3954393.1 unnamed protein product [Adineta steineri]